MHRVLNYGFAVTATICLVALAFTCNTFQGQAPSLPGAVPTDLSAVAVAHGPTMPPYPWEVNRVAHGPTMPPYPWEVNRVAHGPTMPPYPWEVDA